MSSFNNRRFGLVVLQILFVCFASVLNASEQQAGSTPNIVMIYADDLGYGDVGCYGARWKTPNLDRLAAEGIRFTDFYVAQPVCSASRTALLTGCYPNRLGIHGALGPNAKHGISADEMTLAELVKQQGYATAAVGKWHLGHHPEFLPTQHGFDQYLGLPYSNDMWPHHPEAKPSTYPKLPLIDGKSIVDDDVTADDQMQLTGLYTQRAISFIEKNRTKPFLLYVAHSMPHVPLFTGEAFRGASKQGVYADVIQEIDWSVGQILEALQRSGIEKNTLVMFASDNGPWLSYGNHGGSAGSLREGKGTVWEGGVRVPFIARWPGKIPAGSVCHEPAMTIDLFPTIARITGAKLPPHKIDGLDILPLLTGVPGSKSPQLAYFFYYHVGELHAVRSGRWKLILPHTYRTMQGQPPGKDGRPGQYRMVKVDAPELYDLENDPKELQECSAQHPEIVRQLQGYVENARADLGDTLTKRVGAGVRTAGKLP
ncbi:MAG: atsA 3 [Planctomycetaceae bacterium]|nr:atsA 3 [Planctomycetaceae bacterium]